MTEQITEALAGTVLEASAEQRAAGRYKVLIINEGMGSSGRYPKATLQEAARAKVIPKGTQSYIDHSGASEERDRARVGRSVRDLAGVLTEDAYWDDANNGLVAEMRVYGPYKELLAEMHQDIGLSIKGEGELRINEAGEREIASLTEVRSVDWVTKAGRGGRVLELLESARPTATHLAEARNVGQWVESAIHRDFTVMADNMAGEGHLTREERIQMSSAIGDALAAFVANLEANAPQLYQRDLWDEPAAPAVSESTTDPSLNTTKEGLVPELTEAEVTALRDSAAQAEAALAEAAALRTQLAESQARATARPAVAAKVAESKTLGARTQLRLVESIVAGLPVVDGAVTDQALTAAVESAVTAAEAEIADYAPAAPTSLFGSFGSVTEAANGGDIDAEFDKTAGSAFGRKEN